MITFFYFLAYFTHFYSHSLFQVYFFNLTNAEAVFKGLEKPKLVEVGPYTYTQKWTKQNITWHENGTLSYRTRKIFT